MTIIFCWYICFYFYFYFFGGVLKERGGCLLCWHGDKMDLVFFIILFVFSITISFCLHYIYRLGACGDDIHFVVCVKIIVLT